MLYVPVKTMRLAAVVLVVLLTAFTATASTVNAKVTYVAASSFYIDAGTEQGVQKGDSGEVVQKGKRVGRVLVEFVADKSSSCKALDSAAVIHVGDAVILDVAAPVKTTEAKPDSALKETVISAQSGAPVSKTKQKGARFSGNVGLQILGQTSHDQLDYSFYQPGLVVRAKLENLFGSGPTMNVRMNLRRNIRNIERPGVPRAEWLSRVYEVSLTYDDPGSRVNCSVGRLLTNHLAGIGYIDGALLGVRMANHMEVGAFGGTQPDLRTTDVRTSTTKGGAYAVYQRGAYGSELLSITLAAAGEYYKGQISREFMYEQTNYAWRDQISAYQSAEINVNRGWRKTAQTSALELTNFLFNLRYCPTSAVAVTASYDNRIPYRTYETRNIADSLFDTSLQQGYRLGIDVRLPWAMQADVEGGLRTRRLDRSSTRTASVGLSTRNLLDKKVYLGGRVAAFTGKFGKGYQPTAMISRMFWSRVTLGVQIGWDVYDLKSLNQKVSSNWQRASVDWTVNRFLYSSVNYELYRGDNMSGNRYYAEMGCRF